MTDLYSEWRDFYAEKVLSWMSLEELRAECGKLQTVDSRNPEVLLVHAMHALEELQAEVERLRDDGASRDLLDERDALREALKVLVNWIPSADTYRRMGFDPETPMRAHEAAKAALRYHDQKGNA